MKYIKKFNEDLDDEKSIEDWCRKNLLNFTINEDGIVDVDWFVNIYNRKLKKIPIQFGIVHKSFCCNFNNLTTLEGSPREVYGEFWCFDNELITLEGGPKIVGEDFSCYENELISLIGGPKEVGGGYYCRNNKLISLDGYPEKIGGDFNCVNNPITELYKVFNNYKSYINSLDYNYLRGTNIIKLRFQEACEEAVIRMPKSIPGYKYI